MSFPIDTGDLNHSSVDLPEGKSYFMYLHGDDGAIFDGSIEQKGFFGGCGDGRNPAPVDKWCIPLSAHYLQCFIVIATWCRISSNHRMLVYN